VHFPLHKGSLLRGAKTSPKRLFTRFVHISVLACLGSLALISPTALAGEPDVKNNLAIKPNPTATLTSVCDREDKSNFDTLIYATCHSERFKAVTVIVSGNAKGITGKQIAEHIVNAFGKNHIPAAAYLDMPDWDKVTVSYLLNGDYYGPYSGKTWKEGKKILTVHSAQAWYGPQTKN